VFSLQHQHLRPLCKVKGEGNGCVDPRVLGHNTSFKSVSLPGRFTPGTYWTGGWVGPRAGLDDVKKKKFLILPGLELRPLDHTACSQSLYRLSYPGAVLFTERVGMAVTLSTCMREVSVRILAGTLAMLPEVSLGFFSPGYHVD
jgi:hypothetical protein